MFRNGSVDGEANPEAGGESSSVSPRVALSAFAAALFLMVLLYQYMNWQPGGF